MERQVGELQQRLSAQKHKVDHMHRAKKHVEDNLLRMKVRVSFTSLLVLGLLVCGAAEIHPVNVPDLIWIGSEALARSGPDDSCTLVCFWTGCIWPKPDSQPELNRIWASFAQHDPGFVWKNTTGSESF